MTIFGPDISSYQSGLALSKLRYAAFVIAKTTQGTYYTDDDYQAWRVQARAANKPFIWYHFLSGESVAAQVSHTNANVGDKTLPGMLDVEPTTGYTPTFKQMLEYIDVAHSVGLNLRLVYLPEWVWEQMGRPSLKGLSDRNVHLVSSSYPGGFGYPQAIYPGDRSAGWQSYGGVAVEVYQFTNQATDAGMSMDYNAYLGTIDQFNRMLYGTPLPVVEDNMPMFQTVVIEKGLAAPGVGNTTVILPPPANSGAAGWKNVWFSLGSDSLDPKAPVAHVRAALFVGGVWTDFVEDFAVDSAKGRVLPFPNPLPTDVEKISITRLPGSENVPLSCLIEAT